MGSVVLQTLKPKTEEPVIDDVSRVCPVEQVAFRQLGCCRTDRGSGRERVACDEISAGYGLHNTLSANRLQDGLFGGCLASQKVEVERFRLRDENFATKFSSRLLGEGHDLGQGYASPQGGEALGADRFCGTEFLGKERNTVFFQ